MFPHCQLDEREVRGFLAAATPASVSAVLAHPGRPSFTGFVSLLSPAAGDCLAAMRERALAARRRHFGQTVRIYSPLYISNFCVNDCSYCGFRVGQTDGPRRSLSMSELLDEADIIRSHGIKSLLLVSGEDPSRAGIDFLEEAVSRLRDSFSQIGIEIYPLAEDGYRRLIKAGVRGLTLYQETYDRELYGRLHRSGPKADYLGRLGFIENGARAGFHNLGLGFLVGLYDWRIESVSLAAHAAWLRKRHWRSRIQFSFPRITPMAGGFDIPAPVSEAELEQMMLAFRIYFEEADIYISTRESAEFRNRVVQTCASHISAGSKVVPGGYRAAADGGDLGQFSLRDERSFESVAAAMRTLGLAPVHKDWDGAML
jgi:2-iminoacetate synthase